jgi:hypothetical protein
VDGKTLELQLDECDLTDELLEAIPFDTRISTWGDEIYFPVPVEVDSDGLTDEVEVGDVAYWPEGQSLAVFYGPTPKSEDDGQPVPADDVKVCGQIQSGIDRLSNLEAGDEITLRTDG